MRISLKFLGDAFTIMVLFLGTGAFISLLMDSSNPDQVTDGSLVTQFGWSLIYIVVLVRAVPLRREILQAVKANKALLFLTRVSLSAAVSPYSRRHCSGSISLSATPSANKSDCSGLL